MHSIDLLHCCTQSLHPIAHFKYIHKCIHTYTHTCHTRQCHSLCSPPITLILRPSIYTVTRSHMSPPQPLHITIQHTSILHPSALPRSEGPLNRHHASSTHAHTHTHTHTHVYTKSVLICPHLRIKLEELFMSELHTELFMSWGDITTNGLMTSSALHTLIKATVNMGLLWGV